MNTRNLALLTLATLILSGCRQGGDQAVQNRDAVASEATSAVTPAPAAPAQRWELKGVKDGDGRVVELQVFKVGETEPHQRLTGFSASPIEDLENGKIADLNCDGRGDIMLMEFLPAGPNVPYLYWIFNPQSERFECTPREGQDSCSFQFPDPIDCETKQVVTNERDSATTYVVRHWGWQGTQLVTVKEVESELSDNGQRRVTVRERRDGKLEVVSRSIE
jgi:hypothetical protein